MGVIFGLEDVPRRNERYEVVSGDVVETADVCIIGSGAAGAVLAKELVEAGRSVVLLERGGYYEGSDMNQRDLDMMPLLWKNGGFNFDDNLRIAIAQGSCLGGSTIINDAVCFDPPLRVISEWRTLGVDFTDREWTDHTARVNRILQVTEVSEEELNRNNRMVRQGAKAIGLNDHRKNRRNCVNCMQCGFCHLGCHYETKRNVLVTYLHDALQRPDNSVRVYCNCYANRIVHDDGVVEGVEGEFRDIDGNPRYRIRVNAKLTIVSAGAIASSKLMLQNGIAQETAGRGLCLHPAPFLLGDFDYEIKGNQGIPMAYTIHDFGVTRTTEAARDAYDFHDGEFLIEGIFLPLVQLSMAIPAGVGDHRKLLQRLNNLAMAGVLVRDANNGRVSLTSTDRASVQYRLSDRERDVIALGISLIGKMWFALGAKRVISPHRDLIVVEQEADLTKLTDLIRSASEHLLLGSAHPQSGNRIGSDPRNSVVDSRCRVHGFRNLFVCDASVFPTSVGVNPQITVMAVASMTSARILRDWSTDYADLPVSASLGRTGSVRQPMYCDRATLSNLFDTLEPELGTEALPNASSETADPTNWSFDPRTLMIGNNSHWKGIFPRDGDVATTLTHYFGGFWKRFLRGPTGVEGTTHPYLFPVYARNRAIDWETPEFGKAIRLDYPDAPYSLFHDVLKVVNQNILLGKAFLIEPKRGREVLTFSMARRYPFEFMTTEDHAMLYDRMTKPDLETMVGVWDGQLVSDSAWTDPLFRFRYYFDGPTLKNDYVFNRTLAGTAVVNEVEDHLEMQDITGAFHDEIRQVNRDLMVGRYVSPRDGLFRWLPDGLDFLRIDRSQSTVTIPYVLKRIGSASAFREYSD
ncbi:MAG TPA: GMC family oxidoreductase [Thermoplasmata archaeon]|nr:GMC family oxidoreductase [Thermoplasmata archaeon]